MRSVFLIHEDQRRVEFQSRSSNFSGTRWTRWIRPWTASIIGESPRYKVGKVVSQAEGRFIDWLPVAFNPAAAAVTHPSPLCPAFSSSFVNGYPASLRLFRYFRYDRLSSCLRHQDCFRPSKLFFISEVSTWGGWIL